jgi:hypothetical protein
MTINGLHLLLAFVAVLAGIGWTVDYRRRVVAERQRDIAHRIAQEKGRRLMAALADRDSARRHADDVQWIVDAMAGDEQAARDRHPSALPSNVRVLKGVK